MGEGQKHQDRLTHTIFDQALEKLEEEGEGEAALELLLKIKRGDPKNPRFLDLIAQRPGLKKKLERLEGQLSTQKLLPDIDQVLFCVIEENQNIVELTEKGLKLIYGGQ